ncbi:MAG: hypothetical protein ABR924_13465 [Terracidiphilus sp.]|jgi:acetyl-CoA acetyltransferase
MLIAFTLSVSISLNSARRQMGRELAEGKGNGRAIALGHPIGASGRRIAVNLLHEVHS